MRNLFLRLLCQLLKCDYVTTESAKVMPIFYASMKDDLTNGKLIGLPLTNWHGDKTVGTAIYIDGQWYSYYLYASHIRLGTKKPKPITIQ